MTLKTDQQKERGRGSERTANKHCHLTTVHLQFPLFLFILTPCFATFHGLRPVWRKLKNNGIFVHFTAHGVNSKTMAILFISRFCLFCGLRRKLENNGNFVHFTVHGVNSKTMAISFISQLAAQTRKQWQFCLFHGLRRELKNNGNFVHFTAHGVNSKTMAICANSKTMAISFVSRLAA